MPGVGCLPWPAELCREPIPFPCLDGGGLEKGGQGCAAGACRATGLGQGVEVQLELWRAPKGSCVGKIARSLMHSKP